MALTVRGSHGAGTGPAGQVWSRMQKHWAWLRRGDPGVPQALTNETSRNSEFVSVSALVGLSQSQESLLQRVTFLFAQTNEGGVLRLGNSVKAARSGAPAAGVEARC